MCLSVCLSYFNVSDWENVLCLSTTSSAYNGQINWTLEVKHAWVKKRFCHPDRHFQKDFIDGVNEAIVCLLPIIIVCALLVFSLWCFYSTIFVFASDFHVILWLKDSAAHQLYLWCLWTSFNFCKCLPINKSVCLHVRVCVRVLAHNTDLTAEETDSVPELSIQWRLPTPQ